MSKDLRAYPYPEVAPSLLAAPKDDIPGSIRLAEESGTHYLHIDCMDGQFVENTSFGDAFVETYAQSHALVNDVHIMIEKPWLFAGRYCEAGADILSFHLEACPDRESVLSTIDEIRAHHAHPGIALKPHTPLSAVFPYLKKIDLVLIMSVEPGKGGQSFMPRSLSRIAFLKQRIAKECLLGNYPLIEVDGGINELTAPLVRNSGADILVAGSYLYGHDDFCARVGKLLE